MGGDRERESDTGHKGGEKTNRERESVRILIWRRRKEEGVCKEREREGESE